jgi:CheY-like chemotaxis protein
MMVANGNIETLSAIEALKGKRVLIVEDNGLLCYDVEQTLREAGCEIVGPFSRLGEALRESARNEFDVALLDVNLHGEVVAPLAQQLKERHIPYLLASAYDSGDMPQVLGSDRQLRKPFTDADLLVSLASVVNHHGTGTIGTAP